jgi:DNA-binding FrmR family transcriptional regulator
MIKNPDHSDNLVALRRIAGQVNGVAKMIENRKYCVDILTQIQAIRGALSRVEEKILEKHFQNCVSGAFMGTSEEDKKQKLSEIIKLLHQVRK